MTWCTPEQAAAVTMATGVAVEHITTAEYDVAMYAGRTAGVTDGIAESDLEWLKIATAWQAVYRKMNPTVGYRAAYARQSQNGVSVAATEDWQHVLHSHAARALRNLSWLQGGPVALAPRGCLSPPAFELESSDPYGSPWQPL